MNLFVVFDSRANPGGIYDASVLEAFDADCLEDAVYESRECWEKIGACIFESNENNELEFRSYVDNYQDYPKKRRW